MQPATGAQIPSPNLRSASVQENSGIDPSSWGSYPPQCMWEEKQGGKTMLRLFAVAGFLAFATSAQAITPAPLPQQDGMITQVRLGCGLGPELMASAWPE